MKKAPTPATNGPVIAGYFPYDNIYEKNHNVIDIDAQGDKLTHVIYASAYVQMTGEVVLTDKHADTDKHFSAEQSVNGVADSWDEKGNNLYGNFKQLYLLKEKHRQIKVTLSVCENSWSRSFAVVAADPVKRNTFIQTSMKLVQDLGLDGLNIDWEYPRNASEASNYVHLLAGVREALDSYQKKVQPSSHFLLTVAAPCRPENYKILHATQMEPYVDMFYLMSYDYSDALDEVTGHQANIFGGTINTDQAINHYLEDGVHACKIILGLPLYGRGFSDTDGIGSSFKGVPDGTWEAGIFDYNVLPKPNVLERNDFANIASWSYSDKERELISYDTPEITTMKSVYIKQKGLGGAVFWELSADDVEPHGYRNLLNTVYKNLDCKTDQIPNCLDYPLSQYDNVRNKMEKKHKYRYFPNPILYFFNYRNKL